jgi:predicted TIM-barrel enzyme
VRELLSRKPIVGMIHMPALPAAPQNDKTMDELVAFALSEARNLEAAGLDACIVENVGDVPLFRDHVPPATVAAMAAHVCGADFIRCNVVIGAYVTDQGIIQGCAAELARLRRALDSEVLIFGDVHVKHAHPLFDVPIEYAAQDLAERGGVDAVIVSGPRSPIPPTWERLETVRQAVELPVLIGSGIGVENVREFYERADGVLLGEPDFKVGRVWGGESDQAAYAEAVERCRG